MQDQRNVKNNQGFSKYTFFFVEAPENDFLRYFLTIIYNL